MFIRDDESILLMEDQLGGQFDLDELKQLHDVGIQTLVVYPYWRDIETELGVYDWEGLDEQVEVIRKAGLKAMLAVYDHAPTYFPDDWYLKFLNGDVYVGSFYDHVISPWGAGWKYHLGFIDKFCRRYHADDVLCFRATVHGGEVMLPEYTPYRIDGDLESTFLRMMLEEQRIFSKYFDTLWTSLHHAFDGLPYSGTAMASRLYDALHKEFPEHEHCCISYTQFIPEVQGERENMLEMRMLGLKMFCGSEYCEGLLTNTDTAIDQGFRGFITAPLHALNGHQQLEPWMLDAIRESLDKWSRNV